MSSTPQTQHSPLERCHHQLRAKMVPFAGWLMPIQYQGITQEHHSVRHHVGIFDVSHMGELLVCGADAGAWLESILTNRVSKLEVGRGQYSLLLNADGGVIDDLLLYQLAEDQFLLVVNASRVEVDYQWLQEQLAQEKREEPLDVVITNQSDAFIAMALQGPQSPKLLVHLFPEFTLPKRNRIVALPGHPDSWLARTGYTGEDGFELLIKKDLTAGWQAGEKLWLDLVELGATPAGLGARDTLRLEMGYSLYGADLSLEHTPLEANLSFFVPLNDPLKPDFIGRAALEKQLQERVPFQLTPLVMEKKGPPLRADYPIYVGEQKVAEFSSGAYSPSLAKNIGLAYLPYHLCDQAQSIERAPLQVQIRNNFYPLKLTQLPFYKKVE